MWAAISELAQRYAVLVDARELDAVADLFAEDAEFVGPRPPGSEKPAVAVRGRAAIRESLERVRRTEATMHGVLAVTVDGTEGVVSGVAHHLVRADDGAMVDHAWFLRYHDRYVHDGRWMFARREIRVAWIETRPVAR